MKKTVLKLISFGMVLIMLIPLCAGAAEPAKEGTAAKNGYKIVSPYEDVVWSGDNAWGAYKGNLHTHSFVSDAEVDYRDMIISYYEHGFDFLAMTDHGVTGKPWNEKPTELPLYLYQRIIGHFVHYFTDEEFNALQDGSFPVDGKARGRGMLCVTGGNELNALTITKDHVNAIFLPPHAGDNYLGYENDYEGAVRLADHYGAVSFINHPGDWLESNSDRANCSDPEKIAYFADILLRYDSCLGMEVFNEHNGTTGYDRDTWDNLLMACLPYGKRVNGFSNGDTHFLRDVDSSFSVFMMEENTEENVRKTMQSGSFFAVTRVIRKDTEKFGPAEDLDARDTDIPYPMFSDIKVDGHKITVKYNNAYDIKWVADGNVIDSKEVAQTEDAAEYTVDLDEIEGSDDFLYVRCQLMGEGGITLTQAFVIDDGTAPQEYVRDESVAAYAKRISNQFFSLRIFVLFKKLWSLIVK
ncbi:MAG: hypothetical protein IKS39_06745 [Clostridia bacterium]|nr:hypothetical protein [Clostridia bacterium]